MVGTDFRRCEAVSEVWHEHRAGKDVSPRQVADALTFIREIRVFPPQAQTVTNNHQRLNAESRVMRVCGTLSRHWARSGQLCLPSEDLEDLERNRRNDSDVGEEERLSGLERKKRALLNTSAVADTLPAEGFYY